MEAVPLVSILLTALMSPDTHAPKIGAFSKTIFSVRKLTSQPDCARFRLSSQIFPVSHRVKPTAIYRWPNFVALREYTVRSLDFWLPRSLHFESVYGAEQPQPVG